MEENQNPTNTANPSTPANQTDSTSSENRPFQLAPRIQYYGYRVAEGHSPKTAHKLSILWERGQQKKKETGVGGEPGGSADATRGDKSKQKSKDKSKEKKEKANKKKNTERPEAEPGEASASKKGKKRRREPTPPSSDTDSSVGLPAEWSRNNDTPREPPPPPNPKNLVFYTGLGDLPGFEGGDKPQPYRTNYPKKKPRKEKGKYRSQKDTGSD